MVFNGLIELAAVGVVPLYIRIITEPTLLQNNWIANDLFSSASLFTKRELLLYGGIMLLIIYIIKLAVNILNGYFQERFIRGREMRISLELLKRYLFAPLEFHLQRNTSELIRNAQAEVQTMNNGFIVPLLKGISQLLITPLIFISIFLVNPMVSILTIAVLGIAVILFNNWVKKPLMKNGITLQKARGLELKSINQALGGVKELKILQKEQYFLNSYRLIIQEKLNATIRTQMIVRLNAPYLEFIALMGILMIALLVAFSGGSVDQIAAILAFYGLAMFRLKQSIGVIMDSYSYSKANYVSIRPIFNDLKEIPLPKNEDSLPISFNHSLVFENVDFAYSGTRQKSLQGINLKINKGESIGLVGTSGAGKTTFVDVLLGLLKPLHGQILVDGRNISENISSWYQLVGYIPQQIYLIDDTIRANIALGVPTNNINDILIWESLEAAQLKEFVQGLPDGLNTIVGERGIRLSGGQRQRIGIARSLYYKPTILVMDEATSALDNKTEKLFVSALDNLRGEHTILVIAHRISTVQKCDRIIVIENGVIKADGSFSQLVDSGILSRE